MVFYNWGDYITIKYDSNGNLLWLHTYNGGWEDYCEDVAVDDSDNVIVTGFSMGDMNWDWCTIKYNSDGDTLWVRRHDVGLDDNAYGVACDKDGNIIVVGEQGQSPENYAAIVKYSPTGDTLWTKLFVRPVPLDGLMNFVDVVVDNVGDIYIAGVFVLWDSGKGWTDYFITKCNPDGDTIWTFRYDYAHVDEVIGLALDKYGDICVTGTTNRSPNVFEQNYLTIKVKNITNHIYEEFSFPQTITLYPNYPNPFNPSTTMEITLPTANHVMLKVYNFLGQELETLVDDRMVAGRNYVRWDASQYAGGVYFARLTAGDYITYQKLMLIK
jgi:hypothetical protein